MKLDIGCGDSIQKSILKVLFNSEISYLQEFQYGNLFSDHNKQDGEYINIGYTLFGYGNIVWFIKAGLVE